MRKFLFILIIFLLYLSNMVPAYADDLASQEFSNIFENHGAIMLIIDSQSGDIEFANKAAIKYYGYPENKLLNMNIDDINTLSAIETSDKMNLAYKLKRNYFIFKHQLAGGKIRTVEVYSYPVQYQRKECLFSIIYDITDRVLLEEKQKIIKNLLFTAGGITIIILFLLVFQLNKGKKELKHSKDELDNFNELRKTFIDSDSSLVFLKDENFKYVFVNKTLENTYRKKADEIIGHDARILVRDDIAQKYHEADLAVQQYQRIFTEEDEWDGRLYRTTKFPVRMLNGNFGVGGYKVDITEERERKKKQQRVLQRHMILTEVFSRSFNSREDQLDYVLHQALNLTESRLGYIYLYDEEKREFILNNWSKDVMQACAVAEKSTVYQLEKTGIWGEAVRKRKPIILNDLEATNPLKKGYPEGHVALKRFLSVPVMIDDIIVAVIGLANKPDEYDDNDIYEITLLMSGVWNAVERREALEKLYLERNKYLQTLVSIGDAVMVVDSEGKIEMLNQIAESLTGWSSEESVGRHYKEIFLLSHEQEGMKINDPIEEVFETDQIEELENHAMLTSRGGKKYHLEDSAAPIKDDQGNTVGVVLIFRDVTDKKKQIKQIEYLSYHDSLTGLYNRRYFEHQLMELDTEDNLPITIIMGDVNGLKLTNDIFGHTAGDILLEKVGKVLRESCRKDDVIARWGGDEFVILLAKTDQKKSEKMIRKIKSSFANEQIKAIKGSISLGAATKHRIDENLVEVLDTAEERMYAAKILERNETGRNVIETIISSLHDLSSREKEHSLHVSELCLQIGKALNLSDAELKRMKDAAYLHDIGKIVMNPDHLNDEILLNDIEKAEIKKHSIFGYRILNSFDETADLAEIVLAHHENWDGSGYPKGLRGEEIPLLARIIAIAENYNCMDIDRKGITKSEKIKFINDNAGTNFDPKLVKLFVEVKEEDE